MSILGRAHDRNRKADVGQKKILGNLLMTSPLINKKIAR